MRRWEVLGKGRDGLFPLVRSDLRTESCLNERAGALLGLVVPGGLECPFVLGSWKLLVWLVEEDRKEEEVVKS